MSDNLFNLILSGKSHQEVVHQFALMSPTDQKLAAAEIHDEQVAEIATYIVTTLHSVGIQHTLILGAFLNLFFLVVDQDGRRELFDNMLEDLDLSRTQAFRCRAAWNRFGAKFLQESSLHRFFCAESLKILSEEQTPEAAREEAIERARNGHRITIHEAKMLQAKHALGAAEVLPSVTPARNTDARPARWRYSGTSVHIQLISAIPAAPLEIPAVVSDLEAAITALRNEVHPPRLA